MQKKFFLAALLFFLLSFLVLYSSPGVVQGLKTHLNTSDFLEPFTIFHIIVDRNSSPDYVFGAYIPFFDLFIGFVFWLITRNTQLTITLYAIFQPILITACLLYLINCLVGKNFKIYALVVACSALPILIFSTGHLETIFYLFGWHIHVSTIGAGFIILGAMIRYTTYQPQDRKLFMPALLLVAGCTLFTVLCDPGFLSQFIAPAVGLLVVMFVTGVISFRRAAYTILALLYATAGGLALYQIPRLWGSDRVILYGSAMQPVYTRIIDNIPLLIWNISDLFEKQYWIAAVWAAFFLLCIAGAWSILYQNRRVRPHPTVSVLRIGSCLRQIRSSQIGAVRTRLLMVLVFLPLQMLVSILSSLTTGDPAVRYFLPSIFLPLFWGWPILLALKPRWLARLNGRKALALGYSVVAIILAVIVVNFRTSWPAPLPDLTGYYPAFTACMDENAARLNLHQGIAHYWQARQTTLLSKTGLVVAQVYPDLSPMRYLNNSDTYRGDFDFVIIDNNPPPGIWIGRQIILSRFGQPAATFQCGDSDILVYNRPGDTAFRTLFAQYHP